MVYKQKTEVIIAKTKKVLTLIEQRDHLHIDGFYQNRSSKLVIWCLKHSTESLTTFHNYERSLTGCKCCGKERVSKKLMQRNFTKETKKKK